MKTCIIKSCSSTSNRNPNLVFFPFPKNITLRQEWLGVLRLKDKEAHDGMVCQLHFREKDFRGSSRKLLKTHALPVVHLDNMDAENSEDEFYPRDNDSGSDLEILEVKRISKETAKILEEKEDVKPTVKKPPSPSPNEVENTGRRPSRRAAQLAVQKIHNSVRQFGMPESVIENPKRSPTPPPVTLIKVEPKQRRVVSSPKVVSKRSRETKEWHAIRAPVPNIDLVMECHEELLSAVQAETILKAQMEYNTVMKRLRDLKASNAKIICINSDEEMPQSGTQKVPNVVTISSSTSSSNSNVVTVVPVHLVTVPSQTNVIKQPSSPAVFGNITAD